MKKFITALIIILFGSFMAVNLAFATGDTWTQKADLGEMARRLAVGFSIGDKGYVGTGWMADKTIVKDFWEYDPATNAWTQKADFGGGKRWGAVGFSVGNKGYIGTGNGSGRMKDFWEYDPAANTWTRKADFGGVGRGGAVGFSIGNKGYIGTGQFANLGCYEKDFWEYDPPTDTWTRKADFGGDARWGTVGFSISNKGYIGTGRGDGYSYICRKDFWEYDPATDTWTRKADFGGIARFSATGFSIGNKGYIGTGTASEKMYKDFWEYDPATDTWTRKVDLKGTARRDAVGFSIGDKGYIGSGLFYTAPTYEYVYYKDFWEYKPNTADTIPDQFTFNYEVDVDLNTVVTSNTITVTGINAPAPISITGGKYSINSGAYTNVVGIVNNGDKVTVQQTSSGDYLTITEATLIIGGVSDTFSVTTKEASVITLNPVANGTILWPPNNKMVLITIKANASDGSGGPVTLKATVSCNESASLGRDWTRPVIYQKAGVIVLYLRATRNGNGTGRIYTINITATGKEGNSATKAVTVSVPHDQSVKGKR
jgi:N-acetylneuraminic acid mutarotase